MTHRKSMTTQEILKKLREMNEDDDECCRLYILFVCNEFYFPKTSGVLNPAVCKVVEDVDSLDRYA